MCWFSKFQTWIIIFKVHKTAIRLKRERERDASM